MRRPSYFLIAVSTRMNLQLCMRHALAGFTNSHKGAWTFHEVRDGDLVSFLYGARVHNLYRVVGRQTYVDASAVPPWVPITFVESGRTYSFPFRLQLEPIRLFTEPIVRSEFAYVAENLLLRAGYAKTHFQADQTTLQYASQMGEVAAASTPDSLPTIEALTCQPRFVFARKDADLPCLIPFDELILQTIIRLALNDADRLRQFMSVIAVSGFDPANVEVLGEKGLSYGHIDLLVKESVPIGRANKVAIEVKLRRGKAADVAQTKQYVDELGPECVGAALIAEDFERKAISGANADGIRLVRYQINAPTDVPTNLESLVKAISFSEVPVS